MGEEILSYDMIGFVYDLTDHAAWCGLGLACYIQRITVNKHSTRTTTLIFVNLLWDIAVALIYGYFIPATHFVLS